jgi:NAD-dependent dihydropyrimidine dehydrogenase PreA subunit
MNRQTAWVDVDRCTGCGACVEMCPVGAISLVDGRARVDEETCTGCGACVDACPEDAVHLAVQGELVPAPERPVPTAYEPSPLAQTAGAAVVTTGVGLLVKAAGALARAAGRWLTQRSAPTGLSPRQSGAAANNSPLAGGRRGGGRGRGRRHKHRGGRG